MSRVAVIQLTSESDIESNCAHIDRLLAQASAQGAQLALLPEMLFTLDKQFYRQLAAEPCWLERLAQWARTHQLWLVAGAVPQPSPDGDARVRSASLVFNTDGDCVARYDKVHLFDVDVADEQGRYRESEQFSPGDEWVVVDTPVGRLGLAICFDVRFPHVFQRLRAAGAELISLPAAFTYHTGEAHWQVLLRARAIEQQCYVLAANQCGWHDERRQTWGHSQIVDPWGRVLIELAHEPGVALAEIDLTELHALRQRMPLQARLLD
ncbi:MAG: carbon-nitrogen hydrolase family protein [Bacterioplanes sp.]|nr:carbon-nitrogen hydrolase family protein [Bacterioplanes sp.]